MGPSEDREGHPDVERIAKPLSCYRKDTALCIMRELQGGDGDMTNKQMARENKRH